MRGKQAPRREPEPDPKFNSTCLARFMNTLMERGKKNVAQQIVYDAFDIVKEKTKQDPMDIFNEAIKNVSPLVEVRARRVGGSNYQIPVEVKGNRRLALAFRWIIHTSRAKKGKAMREKLAQELMDAAQNQGDAIKKKLEVQRMAEANRAFAHFA